MSRNTSVPQSPPKTRRKFVRLQMVHAGVLTPAINDFTRSFNEISRYDVPFVITLEPLLFGLLPSSLFPVALTILVILVAGIPIAMKIHCYLEGIAQQAKEELVEAKKDRWCTWVPLPTRIRPMYVEVESTQSLMLPPTTCMILRNKWRCLLPSTTLKTHTNSISFVEPIPY